MILRLMKSVNDLIAVQESLKSRKVDESVQVPQHLSDGQVQVQLGMDMIKRMTEAKKTAPEEPKKLYGQAQFAAIGI
jgi:hypothetical protein